MRKSLIFVGALGIALSTFTVTGCGGREAKEDTYQDGKLNVSVRNLYFGDYTGGDGYLEEIENKFGLKFDLSSYEWAQWSQQINGAISGDNMTDIFHANIDSYNFANLYKFWAEEEMIKPLPTDLSKWPNLKRMIDNTTNIDSLKLDGVLYGIPIAKNTTDFSTTFSPFTYMYRRDWAKKYGVYQENDEYTWDQFKDLLEVFRQELVSSSAYALGDVEWGFPSITNFYKQVPHCFAQDETGKYVNNYTTPEYIKGLEESKTFRANGWYYPSQNDAADGDLNKLYYSNKIGVFYENLSYENFVTLKKQLKDSNVSKKDFNVEDATAIMKIRGEDGKYVLEGTDNWFSMTFFDFKISDTKMNKVLDLLDWLLSAEGTTFAIYGFENYDYIVEDGKIKIQEEYWPKAIDGTYARKDNGAKYLRYLVSLGYDTFNDDPLTDKAVVNYLDSWNEEMKEALANNELKVLKETAEVMWLTTPEKAAKSGSMRKTALDNVMKYIYNKIPSQDAYKATFNNSTWSTVLDEINNALGKN